MMAPFNKKLFIFSSNNKEENIEIMFTLTKSGIKEAEGLNYSKDEKDKLELVKNNVPLRVIRILKLLDKNDSIEFDSRYVIRRTI